MCVWHNRVAQLAALGCRLLACRTRFLSLSFPSTRSALSLVLAFALTLALLTSSLAAYYSSLLPCLCLTPRLHHCGTAPSWPQALRNHYSLVSLHLCYTTLHVHPASMTTCLNSDKRLLLLYSHSSHFRDRTFQLQLQLGA